MPDASSPASSQPHNAVPAGSPVRQASTSDAERGSPDITTAGLVHQAPHTPGVEHPVTGTSASDQPPPSSVPEPCAGAGAASPSTGRVALVITGPPCSGKSSVAQLLAERILARLVHIPELARAGRRDGWLTVEESHCAVPGELDTAATTLILRTAFQAEVAVTTVFDGVHATPGAFLVMAAVARTHHVAVRIVELAAPDPVLLARHRRHAICPHCTTSPHGDRYAAPLAASSCSGCGRGVYARVDDTRSVFLDRLERYHAQRPALRAVADREGCDWTWIDATARPDRCVDEVVAALRGQRPSSPPAGRGSSATIIGRQP